MTKRILTTLIIIFGLWNGFLSIRLYSLETKLTRFQRINTLSVNKLQLVDTSGNKRAVLSMKNDEPYFNLIDKQNNSNIYLGITYDKNRKRHVSVLNVKGSKARYTVKASKIGTYSEMTDKDGTRCMTVNVISQE